MPEGPTFSVVIPAYNEAARLPGCLDELDKLAAVRPFEILVVDNNSMDGTAEVATDHGARVLLCRPQGISAARNLGAVKAAGTHLCFLDADALVSPGWLGAAQDVLMKRGIRAVSGWNLFRERNPVISIYYNSYNFYFTLFFLASNAMHGGMVAGNNMVIEKKALLDAGGFPNFVGEDMKLSRILARRGVRTAWSPRMKVSYSARRFRARGFLSTVALWIRSASGSFPEEAYALDYKNKKN